MKQKLPIPSQLSDVRRSMYGSLLAIGLFSAVVNILMLTGPLFMLQVYDRVLASQSVNTLLALGVLAAMLYLFMGLVDTTRARVLIGMGHRFEQRLAGAAFSSTLSAPNSGSPSGQSGSAIRNLEQVRSFLSGQGAAALFDLPWMPVYLGLVFALHTWLGLVGLIGATVLLTLAVVTDFAVRKASVSQAEHAGQRARLADAGRRNADMVRAMGMQRHLEQAWTRVNDLYLGASARSAITVGLSSSVTKVFRLGLQSVILAVAAYLAIHNQVSAGSIVAASVITSRALQPIETLVGSWRGLVGARQAWRNLAEALSNRDVPTHIDMPPAKDKLSVEGLYVVPPGSRAPTLKGLGFTLNAGEALAVVGPTGGGKSTLARALVTAWPSAKGTIRLDDVPVEGYRPEDLGRQIGFLPQDIELFDGSIAENISRFDPNARDEDVIAAAQEAGVHELVANLEGDYGFTVGERGAALSGGQRQRIGLARALYGEPFLVVLDEPNSNLDAAGEMALNQAIHAAKSRGAIVVVIAHRPSVLGVADKVLVMDDGHAVDFGPRDQVLKRLQERNQAAVSATHANSGGKPPGTDNCKSDQADGPRPAVAQS